ncbi:MAG: hypothetical protein R3264_14975, partial [Anaerolineae bacterium]|nr:hypothetical protein [Anaerolineae bacterium]
MFDSHEPTRSGQDQLHLRQDRDLRVRLLQLYILFAILILVVALLFASFLQDELEVDVKTADFALAQAIALQFDGQALINNASLETADWLAGEETAVLTIVNEQGDPLLRQGQDQERWRDAAWNGWQRIVARTALREAPGSTITTAPDERDWLHSYARTPDGEAVVILQRPTRVAFTGSDVFKRSLFIAISVYLAG